MAQKARFLIGSAGTVRAATGIGVMSDRKVIDRGLAPTSTQARAQALKVAASHALWQPTDSTRSFKRPESTEAP
jgi:hypothetical protein